MALPTSGNLSFDQIAAELGLPASSSMDDFLAAAKLAGFDPPRTNRNLPISVGEFYGYSHQEVFEIFWDTVGVPLSVPSGYDFAREYRLFIQEKNGSGVLGSGDRLTLDIEYTFSGSVSGSRMKVFGYQGTSVRYSREVTGDQVVTQLTDFNVTGSNVVYFRVYLQDGGIYAGLKIDFKGIDVNLTGKSFEYGSPRYVQSNSFS